MLALEPPELGLEVGVRFGERLVLLQRLVEGDLEVGVRFGERLVLLLRLVKDDLEVFDALVFPLPVGSLGCSILSPPSLQASRSTMSVALSLAFRCINIKSPSPLPSLLFRNGRFLRRAPTAARSCICFRASVWSWEPVLVTQAGSCPLSLLSARDSDIRSRKYNHAVTWPLERRVPVCLDRLGLTMEVRGLRAVAGLGESK
jgi:hypothetical protein